MRVTQGGGRRARFLLLVVLFQALVSGCQTGAINNDRLERSVRDTASSVVGIGSGQGVLGSGFRLASSRIVVTAAHVVVALKGSEAVVSWHGQIWTARIMRVEEAVDLALLELPEDAPMPGLELSSADRPLAPGQSIFVLGCPFGTQPSVSAGIISALPGAILKPEALRSRLQLNAAINPGNSGGPVLDLDGRVIGVASAAIMGGYGLGFAVPVGDLARLLNAERESGSR